MPVLSSLYSEDVQLADCLNVHPPPKKRRRYFHALPLVALPPLVNYLHINHNSFTSFKMYIHFLFKAQTMNEEVLWVQVYAASNGCTSFKMYIHFLFKAQTMNEEVLWVQVYAASNGCTHGQGQG